MSKCFSHPLLKAAGLILPLWFSVTAHAADSYPHLVNNQSNRAGCTDCHVTAPEIPGLNNNGYLDTKGRPVDTSQFKEESQAYCMTCHPRDLVHENVAGKIIFSLPPDIPVSEDHAHTCLTCHYTHGKLDSDQPQADVNFIDYLFDTERLHKSYLLRRDNSEGGLCFTCHNTDNSLKN